MKVNRWLGAQKAAVDSVNRAQSETEQVEAATKLRAEVFELEKRVWAMRRAGDRMAVHVQHMGAGAGWNARSEMLSEWRRAKGEIG